MGVVAHFKLIGLFLITGMLLANPAHAHRNHDADGICLRDGTVLILKPENQVQRKAACRQAKGQWMIPDHDHSDEQAHDHSQTVSAVTLSDLG